MCTGNFHVHQKTPFAGSKCALPSVYQSDYWGDSWCFTKADGSQWGAPCVPCSGGNFKIPLNWIHCVWFFEIKYIILETQIIIIAIKVLEWKL